MGLFTGYLLYRAGKKRAQRQLDDWLELNEICDNCGYEKMYHSAFMDRCPEPE